MFTWILLWVRCPCRCFNAWPKYFLNTAAIVVWTWTLAWCIECMSCPPFPSFPASPLARSPSVASKWKSPQASPTVVLSQLTINAKIVLALWRYKFHRVIQIPLYSSIKSSSGWAWHFLQIRNIAVIVDKSKGHFPICCQNCLEGDLKETCNCIKLYQPGIWLVGEACPNVTTWERKRRGCVRHKCFFKGGDSLKTAINFL